MTEMRHILQPLYTCRQRADMEAGNRNWTPELLARTYTQPASKKQQNNLFNDK